MPEQIGLFIGKCFLFSLIFFASWLLFFRPANNYLNERAASQTASKSQDNDSDALMKKYWEQADRADRLQKVYEDQQAQAARTLKKQDELLSRWEKVIQKWEKR
jgi:hypothetical protein